MGAGIDAGGALVDVILATPTPRPPSPPWTIASAHAGPLRAPERVFEHELEPDGDGLAQRHEPGRRRAELRWDAATMPRMWQWVHPSYGVLGLEPANCSVLGVAHDRAAGRLPKLAPGEERRTRLEITVRAIPR